MMHSCAYNLRQTRQPGREAEAISSNFALALVASVVVGLGGLVGIGLGGLVGTGLGGLLGNGLGGRIGLIGFGFFASQMTDKRTKQMRRLQNLFMLFKDNF